MNANSLLNITLLGFFAGTVGTGLGGLSTYFIRNPSNRLHSVILGFSGGLMISIVCFDLLPEAFSTSLSISLVGVALGVFLIIAIDEILSKYFTANHMKDSFLKTGILMGISIAAHNFPEGLAIGSGLAADTHLGLSLAIIILIHNIPEGMSMAAPFAISGTARYKILLYTIYAGLPMGVGAFLGGYIGNISENFISLCLGFAAGAMLFITCQEIIPKSSTIYQGHTSATSIVFGVVCGILLTKVLG